MYCLWNSQLILLMPSHCHRNIRNHSPVVTEHFRFYLPQCGAPCLPEKSWESIILTHGIFRQFPIDFRCPSSLWGLPGGTGGKELVRQCRRHKRRVQSLSWEDFWRRAGQSTLIFLPGESPGQRSLVGYSPWGRRVRHN